MQNTGLVIFLLILYILFGASTTIIIKHLSFVKSKGKKYDHDWFLNLLMFFSEMSGLPIFCYLNRKSKNDNDEENENENEEKDDLDVISDKINKASNNKKISNSKKVLYTIIPFLFDNIATFLSILSLDNLPGSIFMMLKGLVVVAATFLLSKFYLKNKHIIDHYISIIVSSIGFVFIGLSLALNRTETNKSASEIILGIAFIVIAMILQSIQYILEEHYMNKYNISQFFFLGFEGLLGFIFNIILCIIFYNIKCDTDSKFRNIFCSEDGDGIWRVENILFVFEQMGANSTILILNISLIFIIGGYNLFGISLVKYKGAVIRSLTVNMKTFLVWIYFMIPWVADNLREKFEWFKLIGLIFIFMAILIYFGIFKIDEKVTIRRKLKELNEKDDSLIISRDSSINEQ